MPTTIYDVAYKAGVSISTVSRVLNNKARVDQETRRKIEKAIEELDYRPNQIARGLVVQKVNLIQVCFSWSSAKINLENPWYMDLLTGINDVVQERKYGLLINTISGVYDPKEVYRRVSKNAVDGVLLVSPYLKEEELTQIKDYPVPVVLIGCRVEDPQLDYVDSDNAKAVAEVVDHLVKKGHKKIACITGEVEISQNAADRLREFRKVMARHSLPVPENYVVGGDFGRGSGEVAMKTILALKNRPTAVFACNDQMAMGAWDVMEEAGLKVGKNMALVGFDDVAQASEQSYPLTTVRQDYGAISRLATQTLIDKIQNPDNWRPKHVLIPTQLVVRKSCGPRRK